MLSLETVLIILISACFAATIALAGVVDRLQRQLNQHLKYLRLDNVDIVKIEDRLDAIEVTINSDRDVSQKVTTHLAKSIDELTDIVEENDFVQKLKRAKESVN